MSEITKTSTSPVPTSGAEPRPMTDAEWRDAPPTLRASVVRRAVKMTMDEMLAECDFSVPASPRRAAEDAAWDRMPAVGGEFGSPNWVSEKCSAPYATKGVRFLRRGRWHDDNGPITAPPCDWAPPITVEERHTAAMIDRDNTTLTDDQPAAVDPGSLVNRIMADLGMSQAEFAATFRIPLSTLEDWERHRAEPDEVTRTYLTVISRMPNVVAQTLKQHHEEFERKGAQQIT
jgi:putative transcriptional regulator